MTPSTESKYIHSQGSLRNRLLLTLMIPLILISSIFAFESYENAYSISKSSFDKSLAILSLTLIEQDDNIFGNRLSDEILTVYEDAVGDDFFYHAIVLKSSVITGYAHPPRPTTYPEDANLKPFLYDSQYHGKLVRAAFVSKISDNPEFPGEVHLTVWQTFDNQTMLQNQIFVRSLIRILSLIILVASTCWFAVSYGLKPLDELQNAIKKRTITDLEPIKRSVPIEVKSLVESMNDLFSRLQIAIKKRETFLANASHQLKTPLANMQGKAELALRANDQDLSKDHIRELISINKKSSRLTSQMLSLLRAESDDILINPTQKFELNKLVKDVCIHYAPSAVRQGRDIHFIDSEQLAYLEGHPLLITESIGNLIENSMAYSHPNQDIEVGLALTPQLHGESRMEAIITISDAGPGIPSELHEKTMFRFYRASSSVKVEGCGLGLAIVNEIIKNHQGDVYFENPNSGQFISVIRLPVTKS